MKTTNITIRECTEKNTMVFKIVGINVFTWRIKLFVFLLRIIKRVLPLKSEIEFVNELKVKS